MKERKKILLTGATSGIGKTAALRLAGQGHHVIVHGRCADKAERTKQEILARVPDAEVDVMIADLTRKADILSMVDTFNNKFDGLDVLVNNAGGVMNKQREETIDGWEKTMAVNVLAPYMLSALLYPQLSRQPNAQIINTASTAHRMAKADIDGLLGIRSYSPMQAYADAKLYIILLGQEFAKQQLASGLSGHPVMMNAFHPGVVATNFAVESNSFYHYFFKLLRPFLVTVEKGADRMVYLANQEGAVEHNGAYFVKRKPAKVHLRKSSEVLSEKIWNEVEKMTDIPFDFQNLIK